MGISDYLATYYFPKVCDIKEIFVTKICINVWIYKEMDMVIKVDKYKICWKMKTYVDNKVFFDF